MLWLMGYGRIMGYGPSFDRNRTGSLKLLWVMAGYGLSQVWLITSLTVLIRITNQARTVSHGRA